MELSNITELFLSNDVWTGLAHYYISLPLFPVFNIVHYILTAAALRNEPGALQFAFKHPVASCVLTFIVAVSGGILANIALARPPLECVLSGWNVVSCILCWYMIFFSPMDLCYILTLFTPFKLALLIVEEFARAKKVYAGITLATSVYPNSLLAIALIGMFKGSGKRWGVTLYRLSYNPQSAGQHELLQISYVTKVAFLIGLLFAYNQTTSLVDPAHVVLLSGILLASFRLALFFYSNSADPFSLPQNFTWKVMTIFSLTPLHGGLVNDEHGKGLTLKSHDSKNKKSNTSGKQANAKPSDGKQKSD